MSVTQYLVIRGSPRMTRPVFVRSRIATCCRQFKQVLSAVKTKNCILRPLSMNLLGPTKEKVKIEHYACINQMPQTIPPSDISNILVNRLV